LLFEKPLAKLILETLPRAVVPRFGRFSVFAQSHHDDDLRLAGPRIQRAWRGLPRERILSSKW